MKTVKIKVNHESGFVTVAPMNAIPSIGSSVSILEILNCPSERAAIRGVRDSSILYWKIKPQFDFSKLGLGKIISS